MAGQIVNHIWEIEKNQFFGFRMSEIKFKKELVLFDLDGVLIDSKRNMELSWEKTCEVFGLNIDFNDYFSKIGRPFIDILNLLRVTKFQEEIEKTFNNSSIELMDRIEVFPGVKETLNFIKNKGIKTGIVTSKNNEKTMKILDNIGFDFDIVQTPNQVLKGKPSPDHILHAMSKLNINPRDVLFIGDMEVDCIAAYSANVDYAHADWGYGLCTKKNVINLKNIGDLKSKLL